MATPLTSNPLPLPNGSGLRIAIVATRWHTDVVEKLLEGALKTLESAGVLTSDVSIHRCPGAFELPVTAAVLARAEKHDAVITLGCVIRGETPHFDFVAGPVAQALQIVQIETGVPVIFGVLTTNTAEQAHARAGGTHGNKGADAAVAAIEMALLLKRIRR